MFQDRAWKFVFGGNAAWWFEWKKKNKGICLSFENSCKNKYIYTAPQETII